MARVILGNNETHTVFNNNQLSEVFGSNGGADVVVIGGNTKAAVSVQSSVERVELVGKVGEYTYIGSGNELSILSNGVVQAIVYANAGSALKGTQVAFADGSTLLTIAGGVLKLGEAAVVKSSAPGAVAGVISAAAAGLNVKDVSTAPTLGGGTVTTPVTSQTFTLTTDQDNLVGNSGNNTFVADAQQNDSGAIVNSFSTGDRIDGGDGTLDEIYATLINDKMVDSGEDMDINARTTSVEVARFEVLDEGIVVDAGNMDNVAQFWSVNSDDAGLRIEDVRLGTKQSVTKDITFGMKDVDFESDLVALFDSASLRNAGTFRANSQILVEVGYEDTPPDVTQANPTKDLFLKISFTQSGKAFDSGFLNTSETAGVNPDTYAGLRDLIKAKLVAQGFPSLVVEFGSDVNFITTDAGVKPLQVTAKQIVIRDPAGLAFDNVKSAAGATNNAATSDVASRILTVDPSTSTTLIESNLILDNAGRGSTAGDVMIGAMSNSNAGVEKFNVFVDRDSAIESLGTTNNKLKEIVITSLTGGKNGSLEIAQVAADNLGVDINGDGPQQASLDLIDASGFKGANLMLGKSVESDNGITGNDETATKAEATAVKNLKTLSANIASNVTFIGSSLEASTTSSGKAYIYTTGSGKDVITYALDGDSVDSNGESMTFNVGDGDNTVTVELEDQTTVSYTTMAGLKNLSITAGAGADKITNSGVGRFDIKAGGGTDTVIIESRNDADVDAAAVTAAAQVSTLKINVVGTLDAGDLLSVNVGGVTYSAATIALLSAAIDGGPLSAGVAGSTITVTGLSTGAAFTIGDFALLDDPATSNVASAFINTTTTGSAAVAGGTDQAGNATTGTWNISVTDEDASVPLATFVDRVLYQAKLTVNFAGFESQVPVVTSTVTNFVATQLDINAAIKAAIDANSELKRLLTVTDTTDKKGLIIKSTVEGLNDLTIDLFQPELSATPTGTQVAVAAGDVNSLRSGLIATLDMGSADSASVADDSAQVADLASIISVFNGVTAIISGTRGHGYLVDTGAVASTNTQVSAFTFLATGVGTDGTNETNIENFSVINMGAGTNDLVVLNSDNTAADTDSSGSTTVSDSVSSANVGAFSVNRLVFNADWNKVSVVNFFTNQNNGTDGGSDNAESEMSDSTTGSHVLDFTFWLDDRIDTSTTPTGNSESSQRVGTTVVVGNIAATLAVTAANQVIVVNDFTAGTGADAAETWANLTATNLKAALEGTAQGTVSAAYGNLAASADAAVSNTADDNIDGINPDVATALDTAKIDSIFMIENHANQGEYKVFNVEWSNIDNTSGSGSIEDASVTLVGVIDFGESIGTATTYTNFVSNFA